MNPRLILVFTLIGGLLGPTVLGSQEDSGPVNQDRSTIPEVLMRPQRGEAPRYPIDVVIGALDQGDVPEGAYRFAREVLAAFVAGTQNAPVLSAMNSVSREALFSGLKEIGSRKFRLGSGREEADGTISFLVRFMGREQGIAGELYIRRETVDRGSDAQVSQGEINPEEVKEEEFAAEPAAPPQAPSWQLDDLIFEDTLSLGEIREGSSFDLPPYERFF
ncbi:hypothetical protein AGMMS49579_18430 [Spirochaetia bacterium]|nr:hypothetical protein AGMMS49579_18430 [Spirochaetia bacterium]